MNIPTKRHHYHILLDKHTSKRALMTIVQNDDLATAWLNDAVVRKAIHAAPVMETVHLMVDMRKLFEHRHLLTDLHAKKKKKIAVKCGRFVDDMR